MNVSEVGLTNGLKQPLAAQHSQSTAWKVKNLKFKF